MKNHGNIRRESDLGRCGFQIQHPDYSKGNVMWRSQSAIREGRGLLRGIFQVHNYDGLNRKSIRD